VRFSVTHEVVALCWVENEHLRWAPGMRGTA
jgi:hypothetical protein